MAVASTSKRRVPTETGPEIHAGVQLQQQSYRGQYADVRTDRDSAAVWQGNR